MTGNISATLTVHIPCPFPVVPVVDVNYTKYYEQMIVLSWHPDYYSLST